LFGIEGKANQVGERADGMGCRTAALRESVEFSKRAVADSPDTPRDLKERKVAVYDALLRKLPRSLPIND